MRWLCPVRRENTLQTQAARPAWHARRAATARGSGVQHVRRTCVGAVQASAQHQCLVPKAHLTALCAPPRWNAARITHPVVFASAADSAHRPQVPSVRSAPASGVHRASTKICLELPLVKLARPAPAVWPEMRVRCRHRVYALHARLAMLQAASLRRAWNVQPGCIRISLMP